MDSFGGAPLSGTPAINFVIRSDQAGTESLLSAIRNAVGSVNSNLPVFLVRTLKDLYDESPARTSFALVMLAIACVMALSLGVMTTGRSPLEPDRTRLWQASTRSAAFRIDVAK